MSLEVCSNGHEEIVFHERVGLQIMPCPLCEANERITELENIVDDLHHEIECRKNGETYA